MEEVYINIEDGKIYTSSVEKYIEGNEIKIKNIGTLKGKFFLFNSNNKELLKIKEQELSPLWIFEFKEYKFESDEWELEKIGKENKITREKNNEKITLTHKIPFTNYIGKSEIIIKNRKTGKIKKVPVEVVSETLIPKNGEDGLDFDSPLFYKNFVTKLIDEIWRLISALPFNIETPVFVSSGFSTGAPHKIFTFFFLKNYANELKSSLNIIRANPYRVLSEEKEFVNISEVSEIDNDTIYNILTHPEYLYECETGFEVKGKYYAPLKLLQPVKYEILDTPENRFVLYFVKLLLRDIEDLMEEIEEIFKEEKNKDFGKTKKDIENLKGLFEDFVKDPVWEEVGELLIFPSTSTVLRMRDGYRELYSLYLKYLFSRKPFEKIQEAIDLRKVYDLYEFWCALKLCKMLNDKEIGVDKLVFRAKGELPEYPEIKAIIKDKKFIYQKGYRYSENKEYPYTPLKLKPDFVITDKDEKPILILDAKFSFDIFEQTESAESEEGLDSEIIKGAETTKYFKPKFSDIVKMHAYKDALKAKSAIVLYPAEDKEENRLFYSEEKKEEVNISLKDILKYFINYENTEKEESKLKEKDYKGIGWIPFLP